MVCVCLNHLFSDCTARLESLASNPLGKLRSMSLFSAGLLAASNAWLFSECEASQCYNMLLESARSSTSLEASKRLAEPARVQDGSARSPLHLHPSTSDTPILDGLGPEIIGDQGIVGIMISSQ